MLEAAIIFEFILGKQFQAAVVILLLLFSAIDGEIQEQRAKKAIGFLHQKLQASTRILRDGIWQSVVAKELVPGDIVHLKAGDIVAADLKILRGVISVDQAALTGESADVTLQNGEQIKSGSTVTHGEVIAEVSAIGSQSSYGQTVELSQNSEAPGRLQTLLFNIVRYLAYLDIILAIILVISALVKGNSWQELLPFLVILFIATIPISMPSSFTVANSLEAKKLAQQQILVTGLTGIQEAASLDVLLIDKTGTLTKNRSQIAKMISYDRQYTENNLLQFAAAAADESSHDTINRALLKEFSHRQLERLNRVDFKTFDPAVKYSTATIILNKQKQTVIMGSPTTLQTMGTAPANMDHDLHDLSAIGARILAIGLQNGPAEDFQLIGLMALTDQPKQDAKTAVQKLQRRGIKVMMLTGDTPETARVIAKSVGIGDHIADVNAAGQDPLAYDGFANVFPKDKYDIVKSLQDRGQVVGMTGDGINDAPALKQADVGIAVSTATDVAKRAAKVVLTHDRLLDMMQVIDSGHRVYRRMMTWTITKLARTAELAALLTFGFIFTGFFPVSLSLIVFIVVMNDLVTLVLGTDHAVPAQQPEHWDLPKLSKIAAIFTIGWLALGLGLLWFFVTQTTLSQGEISSAMFLYLIYSAMTTILMTRTEGAFWRSRPSRWVSFMVGLNVVLATLLVATGILTTMISWSWILLIIASVAIATLVLDGVKIQYYRRQK